MAKVILICGKICSGKTTYTRKLVKEQCAVWLSCDDIMLSLFEEEVNELYYKYHDKVEEFLFKQATQIVGSGINAILDFGFWERSERMKITHYFNQKGISIEWHYIDVSDETLLMHIKNRNADILSKKVREYFTDEGLINKCMSTFEVPDRSEIDVWVDNN